MNILTSLKSNNYSPQLSQAAKPAQSEPAPSEENFTFSGADRISISEGIKIGALGTAGAGLGLLSSISETEGGQSAGTLVGAIANVGVTISNFAYGDNLSGVVGMGAVISNIVAGVSGHPAAIGMSAALSTLNAASLGFHIARD